ncbi:hypothetical protein CCAX7_28700 [Capsulimonas corticalis]|uniref:Uncharacterized protein n=1 Tax=Capsulimonas corticalis TaxID=2219043 RepID=A0A402CTA1_9BACT|nr:HEAT repeat domain-containing protein [Capsulimonas corticalis]BDI30819.1 hypothetical protein CCAX7_28700 [Capsulimonas corticalis]
MNKQLSLAILSVSAGLIFAGGLRAGAATSTDRGVTKSLEAISLGVSSSHKLSTQDFASIYHGLKTKHFSASDALAGLSAWVAAKNLTLTQKRQASELCIAMLAKSYPGDPSNDLKPLVITVLGSMGYQRAIPSLVPLLKAPEDTTRLAAQAALTDLGYPAPPIQSLLY